MNDEIKFAIKAIRQAESIDNLYYKLIDEKKCEQLDNRLRNELIMKYELFNQDKLAEVLTMIVMLNKTEK